MKEHIGDRDWDVISYEKMGHGITGTENKLGNLQARQCFLDRGRNSKL